MHSSREPHACTALVSSPEVSAADRGAASRALRRTCAGSPVCGCELLGEALTYSPLQADLREGLTLLDTVCFAGDACACDYEAILADICSRGSTALIATLLRADGHVPPPPAPEPELRPAPLTPVLQGCFVVLQDLGLRADTPCSTAPFSWPFSDWDSGRPRGHLAAEVIPCASEHAAGTIYALESERVFVKPPSQPWNQWRVSWLAYPAARGRRPSPLSFTVEPDGPVGVLLHGVSNDARLSRAPDATCAEARAMPRVEDLCAHAHQCARAAARALPRPRELDAPAAEMPQDALGCEAEEAAARAAVAGTLPQCK